jgi:hypothetical protein
VPRNHGLKKDLSWCVNFEKFGEEPVDNDHEDARDNEAFDPASGLGVRGRIVKGQEYKKADTGCGVKP